MPTRLYLTRAGPAVTPTPTGAWDDTGSVTRGTLAPVKDANATGQVNRAEVDASPTWDVIITQHITLPLDIAQTISGTFDAIIQVFESNADADFVFHLHLWVRDGSDGSVRGTLLSDWIGASEFATVETGLAIPQQTLSSVAASVGDRIVLETGYRATNTHTTSRSGRVRHGGFGADLTNGDTDTTHVSWIEFGTPIVDAETRIDWQDKWYLGDNLDAATAAPPLFRGGWTVTSSALTKALLTGTPDGASTSLAIPTGGTDANRTRLLFRGVSPPLNAGTIPDNTYEIIGIVLEAAVDQDLVWCVHAYLMRLNGDVGATLINLTADPDADNEWPITTAAGRTMDPIAVSTQAITQDDRLVVEIGAKQLGTPAASGNATMRYGGTGADAQVGDTDTNKPTWLEFLASAPPASARRPAPIFVGL